MNEDKKMDKYRKSLKEQDEKWNEYKKSLDSVPSYLVLQRASSLVLDYAHEKRPIEISWLDKEDDFTELWRKMDQMSMDLHILAVIDKALKTVRNYDPDKLL